MDIHGSQKMIPDFLFSVIRIPSGQRSMSYLKTKCLWWPLNFRLTCTSCQNPLSIFNTVYQNLLVRLPWKELCPFCVWHTVIFSDKISNWPDAPMLSHSGVCKPCSQSTHITLKSRNSQNACLQNEWNIQILTDLQVDIAISVSSKCAVYYFSVLWVWVLSFLLVKRKMTSWNYFMVETSRLTSKARW